MSDTDANADDGLETVEFEAVEVGEDGTIVVDDLVAAVDGEGHIIATDETIAIISPDGTTVIDEIFSVADEDGELEVIAEDVTIVTPDEA